MKRIKMKPNQLLMLVCLTYFAGYVFNGCKKDKPEEAPGISTSFTEEFESFNLDLQKNGWAVKSATSGDFWTQGSAKAADKAGIVYGFPAYSYSNTEDEYAGIFLFNHTSSIDSWLITPVMFVKNGDKISFYSRGSDGGYTDRLQVRVNWSSSTNIGNSRNDFVGDFTTPVIDINSSEVTNGFPVRWTRYEYSFSGLSKPLNVRIGFRYYAPANVNARGVGIDQFKFEVL
jgi:hypothetical protein